MTTTKINSGYLIPFNIFDLDAGILVIACGVMAILLLIALTLIIVCLAKLSKQKKRVDKFVVGKNAQSLEKEIIGIVEDNKFLKTSTEKNKRDIRELYKKHEGAYQKMGLVKYDAFNQMGGSLSFCLALLDENDNGFIINSIHSTEGCYSYTKEIKLGKCPIDLGKEEEEALSIARGEKD